MNKGNKDDNIVQFPRLKERLFEKGLDALQNSRLDQAADLFGQAYEIDPDDGEVGAAFVLALYENKSYRRAKEICKELLLEGIGDYFKVVELYLMILIQLNEHKEVVGTISALFDEKEVPFEKEEHFSKLLSFSRRVLDGKEAPSHEDSGISHPSADEKILEGKEIQEQTLILAELVNQNIRPYLAELLEVLDNETAHPFIQTMIVNVLREHGFNEEVGIRKFGQSMTCVPASLEDVFETSRFKEVTEEIDELIAQRNPSLQQQVIETFTRHSFLLYPLEMEWPVDNTALAYLAFGLDLYGEDLSAMGLEDRAADAENDLKSIKEHIIELEGVSSPVL
ncbi:tetratricopeptide repeat protein [Rossellomorea vietnamensis]|uniref:Tetratricopeptide repeat protein n=1 Tax=Rossellomorea vietnamensis TaxID=218284 RepID=A0A5D4MH18_9BACI|nr:tetratricopeptide repeat protein [Rossellomorea vietnamensis]TYS00952.1 tetratricopeptide repeat protein [Rossellomorea vietnamensis]